jgi:hypothetical protein
LNPLPDFARGRERHGAFDRDGHLLRALKAIVRAEYQPPLDDPLDRFRKGSVDAPKTRSFASEHLAHDGCLILRVEQLSARQRLPEHDTHSVDVGAAVHGAAADLLGRHVLQLALELPILGRVKSDRGLRDTEVQDARDAVDPDHDVLRRDVAVDDAQRSTGFADGLVGGVESFEHPRIGTTLGCRMRAASLASSMNIEAKSGSAAQWGCMRLIATVRENPTSPTSRP